MYLMADGSTSIGGSGGSSGVYSNFKVKIAGQTEAIVSAYFTKVAKMVTICIPQLSPTLTATVSLLYSTIVVEDALKPARLVASTFFSNTGDVGIVKWNNNASDYYLTFSKSSAWTVGGSIQPFTMTYESINATAVNSVSSWGTSYIASVPFLSTPILLSNTSDSPNFLVSSSSIYSSTYEPWLLFDGNQVGYWTSRPGTYSVFAPFNATTLDTFNTGTTIVNGAWVKITLNEQKRFNYYRLGQYNTGGSSNALADFTIYGSNDNSSYAIINQQIGYSTAGTSGVWQPNISVGNQQYKYIVFQVTKMAGYGDFVSVVNLDFGYA